MARVREKLYVTVPTLFRCPISMDVMTSPVSLCTGVTYDRSSIQRWLDSGHDTCPATMQVLPSKDFIPNLTLHRLIRLWLLSTAAEPSSPGSSCSTDRIRALIAGIQTGAADLAASLSEIAEFARFSGENRRFLTSCSGFDSAISRALAGSMSRIEVSENAIAILDLVFRENGNSAIAGAGDKIRRSILDAREDCFVSIVFILENGSAKSKVESVRVLEFLAGDFQSKRWIVETRGLLSLLLKLLNDGSEELNDAVFSLLAAVSVTHSAKAELVRCGIVETVLKKLQNACGSATAEKCLRVLAVVATCAEGRAAMAADPSCGAAVTERLAKAGNAAAEDAVAVLWGLCCLCGNERVMDEVAKQNGIAVVLLVMQRGCEEHVRSMCVDLIKVLRKKNRVPLALGSYDTKTTHIKPC